jgi:hypothetical protein
VTAGGVGTPMDRHRLRAGCVDFLRGARMSLAIASASCFRALGISVQRGLDPSEGSASAGR